MCRSEESRSRRGQKYAAASWSEHCRRGQVAPAATSLGQADRYVHADRHDVGKLGDYSLQSRSREGGFEAAVSDSDRHPARLVGVHPKGYR